jgi:hypothetical protein
MVIRFVDDEDVHGFTSSMEGLKVLGRAAAGYTIQRRGESRYYHGMLPFRTRGGGTSNIGSTIPHSLPSYVNCRIRKPIKGK